MSEEINKLEAELLEELEAIKEAYRFQNYIKLRTSTSSKPIDCLTLAFQVEVAQLKDFLARFHELAHIAKKVIDAKGGNTAELIKEFAENISQLSQEEYNDPVTVMDKVFAKDEIEHAAAIKINPFAPKA